MRRACQQLGGARNADEVTTQIRISPITGLRAGPFPATNGSATNAAKNIAVTTPTKTPTLPGQCGDLVGGMPIAVSVTVKTA